MATPQDFALVEHLSKTLFELLTFSDLPENRPSILQAFKAHADLYWGKDARVSLWMAQSMMTLGDLHGDPQYTALGKMAYGDALRFLGRITEAHHTLQEAGALFQTLHDEIGWARTRIGRLLTSQAFGAEEIQQALADIDQARKIFLRQQRFDLLVRLSINLAAFHELRSEFSRAKQTLLLDIELLHDDVNGYRAKLLHNLGILELAEGDCSASRLHFHDAEHIFQQLDQPSDVALVRSSQAALLMIQGHYRAALQIMQSIDAQLGTHERVRNQLSQIVCYQLLGAHQKAQFTALRLVEGRDPVNLLDQATAQMYLGESLAEMTYFTAAVSALNQAESLYREAGNLENVYEVCLRRAYIYLKSGQFQESQRDVLTAADSSDGYVNMRANLVLGALALQEQRLVDASNYAVRAFLEARRMGMEVLRFAAFMLLGNVREAEGHFEKAQFHYQQANSRIIRIQRELTVDFRPGFLESNHAALHSAIRVSLRQQQIEQAFRTLEEMKTLVIFQHLAGRRARLPGVDTSTENHDLQRKIAEFERCREHYQWLMSRETEAYSEARHAEKRALETEMTELRAAIRLLSSDTFPDQEPPEIDAVQARLDGDVGLIEFYSDGSALYAFLLSHDQQMELVRLPASYSDIKKTLNNLRRSMGQALAVGPEDAVGYYLEATQKILQALDHDLFAPIREFMIRYSRLIVVPFGILHSVPFHLLHNGKRYLAQDHLTVILPASGLLTRKLSAHPSGVVAIGYCEGKAEYRMEREAHRVAQIFGGKPYVGSEAISQQLNKPATQILHIAAHGKHNLSQPRLSHLRLADGLMYMDDLGQFDLEYQLVTLSACSVGAGYPSGGDELIGLGHGFLYSGAAALVSSLWDVDDEAAEMFIDHFYDLLKTGCSKADALQQGQAALRQTNRFRHPAYWGAFQLLGDAAPLSFLA
ncbi:MAG: CHAT domain-containing protein [Chloroflexota bacterium]